MSNYTVSCMLNAGQYSALNAGAAYASSTTITDVSPGGNTAGQAFTLPASYLQPGQWLRVRARGIVSNTATPNLTLGVYLGGVAGTALCTTGAIATASSLSNNLWTLESDLRIVTVGTSGSMYAIGSVSGPYAAAAFMPATSSSGNLVSSLNTSSANLVTIGATWGANSSSNSLQVIDFQVMRDNEGSS